MQISEAVPSQSIDHRDLSFLRVEISKKPVDAPASKVSEYAANHRILPPNTPFPGLWRNNRTPYSVEIMDNLSVFSTVQETVVMKAAQLGLTAAAENVLAYCIEEHPAPIMFVSASQNLLDGWAENRLEPLIDSCGLRSKISSQVEIKMSRRSGDKVMRKQFAGGHLSLVSAQAASSLRSDAIRFLLIDEVDGAPVYLRTGEGNWFEVACARTNAWGARKKIFAFSTPKVYHESLINRLYESGDQRKFFVPCPFCGTMQKLKFGSEGTAYGIKPERHNGRVVNVYYECAGCHEKIRNHHKEGMFSGGEWRPSAIASNNKVRSYQISALYSPIGMLSWLELWEKYEEACRTPDGMRSFTNLYLGLPYRESGSKPPIDQVIELRGAYSSGTIPDDVLYLTMGVDVQRGSDTDKSHPPRLEFEILGVGSGYRTWSILYKRIYGEIKDPYGGAWKRLSEWAEDGGLVFRRPDGREISVALVFIDSGWNTDVVYKFSRAWQNTFPCKGFSILKRQKGEKIDEAGPATHKRYRPKKISEELILYDVSTVYYKTQLYNNLSIKRRETAPQAPGFCDFPAEYSEEYFKQLTAANKMRNGSFITPSGRREEALDCRVYALCAADVWLEARLLDLKAAAKSSGCNDADIQKITWRTVIDILVKNNSPRIT